MPIELRVMMYNDQEVVSALAAFYRRSGRPLTVGQISRYVIHENPAVSVTLAVETVDGEVVEHEISESDLAAAVVMQAIATKVPLPAEAEKRILVLENQVTLVIHTRRSKLDPDRIPVPRIRSTGSRV